MQLGQAEAVRVQNHHRGGFGNVYADLDDGRRHEDRRAPRSEALHCLGFLVGGHAPVHRPDLDSGERALFPKLRRNVGDRGERQPFVVVLDAGAHDVGAPPAADLLPQTLPHTLDPRLLRSRNDGRGDLRAARGELAQHGDVEVAEDAHGYRAGDRGGRHDEGVDASSRQRVALVDAEAMLLVDHGEPQEGNRDVV